MMAPAPDAELLAVLLALAGPRTGDPVCVEAPGHPLAGRLLQGLLAMSATQEQARGDARVSLSGGSGDLAEAVRRTGPGGKIVSLADDATTVSRDAASYALTLLHVEPLAAGGLAWVGRLTGSPPRPS